MMHTAVLPEHVIAGTARFQDIIMGDPQLYAAAVQAHVLTYGVWGVPNPDGSFCVLAGGRQMAMPISLRRSSIL